MLAKLVDWWIGRKIWQERQALPRIDWEELVGRIRNDIEGYTVYLETRDARLIPLLSEDANAKIDALSLVIAWIQAGVQPWEMEQPAQQLKERLSAHHGIDAIVLVSRQIQPFAGYYVRVRQAGRT
jgi:hypothetical protein